MSSHQRFGDNLRRHCNQFSSIAEVCRGTGINRQQFNSYLAGRHVPNSATLRRICNFTGISEKQLFERGTGEVGTQSSSEKLSLEYQLQLAVGVLQRVAKRNSPAFVEEIPIGYYYCYFPLHSSANYVFRTLVRTWKKNGIVRFARLTLFPSQSGSLRYLARGKHEGVVLANSKEFQFLGVNVTSAHQLSFLSFDRHQVGGLRIFTGLGIVPTGAEQIATRVALEYVGGKIDLRKAIRSLGPVALNDATLDPVVRALMAPDADGRASLLTVANFDQILPQTAGAVRSRHPSVTHTS